MKRLLEEMRPLEIQDAAARDVPLLLPVGVLENHGYHNPCGLDLLCSREVAELVSDRIEAVVAPPLSYGPGVDAVGSPQMGSLELGYKEFLPHAQSVLAGFATTPRRRAMARREGARAHSYASRGAATVPWAGRTRRCSGG